MLIGNPDKEVVIRCIGFEVKDCIGKQRTVLIDTEKVGIGAGNREGEGGIGIGIGGIKFTQSGSCCHVFKNSECPCWI